MPKSIYDMINDSTDLNKAFMDTLQPLSPLANMPTDYAAGDTIMAPEQMPLMPERTPASMEPPQPINPMVKQALMAKMAPPATSPTVSQNVPSVPNDEDAARAAYEEGRVSPWAVLASGIGQSLAGKGPDRSWADQQDKLVYDRTLGKLALAKKETEDKRRFESEMAFKNKSLAEQIAARKEMAQMARDSKLADLARKNTPEERMKNLSGTDKARFDNARGVLEALDRMGAALDNGDNTFSIIGDNPYTMAQRDAAESYGRMQSGGAINKDEEARFEKMLPRAGDNKEIKRGKIIEKRKEMIKRLETLGFTPEQLGIKPDAEFSYGKPAQQTGPQPGAVEDGHRFKGGDPSDPNNWETI